MGNLAQCNYRRNVGIYWCYNKYGDNAMVNLQEYWSRNDVSYIPFYSSKFTRDRFNQIFWMLHLKTIPTQDAGPRTRLQLVGCFLDYINSKFLKYFTPGREICVDESTIKFGFPLLLTTRRNQPNGVLEFIRWQTQILATSVPFFLLPMEV